MKRLAQNQAIHALLLLPLRISGYLLHSKHKSLIIFSTLMNIIHICVNAVLMIGPLCVGFEYYALYDNDFWAYIGMAIHITACATLLVCLGETLWNRKVHPVFLRKVTALNKGVENNELFQGKFNSIIWKYMMIIVVILILGSNVSSLKYDNCPALAIFYLYSYMMMITRNFQFNVTIDLIRIHLETLNHEIELTIKKQPSERYHLKARETLLHTKETYEKLYEISSMINRYRGLSALFISSLYAVLIVCITYCRLLNFLKNVQLISNTEFCLDIGGIFLALLTTVSSCQGVDDVIQELTMNIHRMSNGESNLALIQQVSTQVDQNKIKFTAMGFFDINYKTLSSLLITSIMYIMILVQFDPTPKKDQMFVIDHHKNWEKLLSRLINLTQSE